YRIEVSEGVKTVDELRDLIINTPDGKKLRLGDIAQIEQTLATPQRNGFFVGGKPALTICVAMENDAIVPNVGHAVDLRMEEGIAALPAGLAVEKIFFQPDKVDSAISSFMLNLLESVVIVVIVLIFAMGFRSGLIIGFGLVLTIALSFPILLQCGTTLQRISLGAFIVAMGMLVDNAVVIMDGILVDRRRGLPESKYLFRIGKNTQWPLLGATIIAAATFICIYLSPDSAGEYAGDLFLVLCVSLLASWVLALVQVPICAKAWLPRKDKTVTDSEAALNSPAHKFVRRTVKFLIAHKTSVIIVSVLFLALCGLGMTQVKNVFFPDFDYKQFVVECYFPAQTSPEQAQVEMQRMAALVSERDGIDRVAVSMGSAPARYCLVRPMSSGGDRYGELIVDCPDYKTVVKQIPELRSLLRHDFPGVYIRLRKYNFSISTTHTVEVEFAGPDPAVLRQLSAQAESIMRKCPYVDAYSVQNNWNATGKTIVADYNTHNGLSAGVGRGDVANALLAATEGMPVGIMNNGDHNMVVNLKMRNADGSVISDLHEIPVWSSAGMHPDAGRMQQLLMSGHSAGLNREMFKSVPLGSVVDNITLHWDENMVRRLNGKRVIEAECDPNPDIDEATADKVIATIAPEIEAIQLPEGYSMRWVGEGELQKEAIGNILKFVPLTIFIILAILLLLFNSWRKLVLILICFPFVICGIVLALLITANAFTFMAIIGLMGLIGMMVKNSIVLVDEIGRLQQEEGYAPYTAVVEATVSRVRPVLMASITTIVGMIPLLTDPMYASMAVTIMGGLAAGTIITLLLLPLFYTAIMRIQIPKSESQSEKK
ncbi:MAG: efflux RND transporter permease subunit, partial [Muribaculaceae bacterium]|nr:efflux RND transporter permease subunit [Muribaculaceae bacterium]